MQSRKPRRKEICAGEAGSSRENEEERRKMGDIRNRARKYKDVKRRERKKREGNRDRRRDWWVQEKEEEGK